MTDPASMIHALQAAQNAHDLEQFVALFHEDYQSEQPCHPDRAFTGRAQVRKNWSGLFDGVPDLRSDLLELTVAGDRAWAEWRWHGTRRDGTRFALQGVTIFTVGDGKIRSGRLYMEPVEGGGRGIDASVRTLAGS